MKDQPQDPEMIKAIYRNHHMLLAHTVGLAATAAFGFTLANVIGPPLQALFIFLTITGIIIGAAALAATIYARAIYRRHPFCPTCGLDAVDCKINRQSLSNHRNDTH